MGISVTDIRIWRRKFEKDSRSKGSNRHSGSKFIIKEIVVTTGRSNHRRKDSLYSGTDRIT